MAPFPSISLAAVLSKLTNYLIVDFRDIKAYHRGSIPGAIHLDSFVQPIDDRPILLYGLDKEVLDVSLICPIYKGHSVVKPVVFQLQKGYAGFRSWVRWQLRQSFDFRQIAGKTGTGKTLLLEQLKQNGAQILNLEELANHRGSSFGQLGRSGQPKQRNFEHVIALALQQLDSSKPIWVEKEGEKIGRLFIPPLLKAQMDQAPGVYLDLPDQQRIQFIDQDYGQFSEHHLAEAIKRIERQLGRDLTELAVQFLKAGRFDRSVAILLDYYDQVYTFQLEGINHLDVVELAKHDQLPELAKKLASTT